MRHPRMPRPLARCQKDGGFTLIEIMVGALLLLMAMAGIVPFFLSGLSQASTIRYKSTATNLARERMEEIRQLDYREITDDPLEGLTLGERFGSTATVGDEERQLTFDVDYTVDESTYEEGILKKVTVSVSWTGPPVVSAAAITTLIHQQFLGPRGCYLEVDPQYADPLGTPFPVIANTTRAKYHIAEADWDLIFTDIDQAEMSARNVYMRLSFFDEAGQSMAMGDPGEDFKIDNSYLRYSVDAEGHVNDVWFEYNFDAWSIPDGYWELRAVAYNQYDQPGNVWRLRVRIEKGAPETPTAFLATPQADNQTVILTWSGGSERDRAYYVLERSLWGETGWSYWITLTNNLDPRATTYTDVGDVGAQLDPWGDAETFNQYQYRLWAVDKCVPGLAGSSAIAEAQIPPVETTTTTIPETTTTLAVTTTTSSTTTTTAPSVFSVRIKNSSGSNYSVKVRDAGGNIVYNQTVKKGDTNTVSALASGSFMVTATANKKPTITQSFSVPAQADQIVLNIL